MSSVVNDENDKLTAPVAYLVDPTGTDPEAIALIERGSISTSPNESDSSFDAHSQTDVIENPTTQQGEVTMTVARTVSDDALEKLGVRDDLNEGEYIRDTGREFDALEVWKFTTDIDPPTSSEVENRDRYENVRVNVGSLDIGDETETFEITLKFEPVNDYKPGYEPA